MGRSIMGWRSTAVCLGLLLGSQVGCGDVDDTAGRTYQVTTPAFDVEPGGELTYCYYTRVGNDAPMGVRRWSSQMTEGSHHLILFRTAEPLRPDGTLEPCSGFGSGGLSDGFGSFPIWTYAAQTPEAEQVMPDGVGMSLAADQPIIVQMHYFNTTAGVLRPTITLDIETYPRSADFIPAGPYITFHPSIEVEPRSTGFAEGHCAVPQGAKFFNMSTHSHRFTTSAEVWDGPDRLVFTEDWEHPEVVWWRDEPFQEFGSHLSYRCDYDNDTDDVVTTGASAETDEMCMAVGYYFPNDSFTVCLGSSLFSL
jgi:hypothetical protein